MKIKIRFKNVFAYGNTMSEFDFSKPGLHLIQGRHETSSSKTTNGTGKTSLLNTLNYGLFGEIPNGFRKNNILNEATNKDGLIEMHITVRGKDILLVRGIDCHEVEYLGVRVKGNFLLYFVDGEDCRGATPSATQEAFNLLIGVDYKSFASAVMFSSATESFSSKTPAKQNEVFSSLCNLQAIDVARKRVIAKKQEINSAIAKMTTEKVKLTATLESSLRHREQAKKQLEEWKVTVQKDIDGVNKRIKEQEALRSSLTSRVASEKVDLSNGQSRLHKLDTPSKVAIDSLESEIAVLQGELSEQRGILAGVIRDKRNFSTALKDARSVLVEGVSCHTCGAKITGKSKAAHIRGINDLLEKLQEEASAVNTKIIHLNKKVATKTKEFTALVDADKIKTALETDIVRLEKSLKQTKGQLVRQEEYIAELRKSKAALVESIANPPVRSEKDFEAGILALKDSISTCDTALDTLNLKLRDYNYWYEAFGPEGIKNYLVRTMIPKLNKKANEFSKVLTNGELCIIFEAQTETASKEKRNKLSVKAVDLYGSDKYSTSSGGESRRVDICVNLALHSLLVERINLGFCFFDEMYLSLDSRGKEKVTELLRYVTKDVNSIFVISNQDDVSSDEFDSRITVSRNGKESRIV